MDRRAGGRWRRHSQSSFEIQITHATQPPNPAPIITPKVHDYLIRTYVKYVTVFLVGDRCLACGRRILGSCFRCASVNQSCSQRWTDWDRSTVRQCQAWTFWRAVRRCAWGLHWMAQRVSDCQMMMWSIERETGGREAQGSERGEEMIGWLVGWVDRMERLVDLERQH